MGTKFDGDDLWIVEEIEKSKNQSAKFACSVSALFTTKSNHSLRWITARLTYLGWKVGRQPHKSLVARSVD